MWRTSPTNTTAEILMHGKDRVALMLDRNDGQPLIGVKRSPCRRSRG